MKHQETLAVCRFVNAVSMHFHIAKGMAHILAHHFVVVARHVNYFSVVFCFAQNRADDIGVLLGPVGRFLQRPKIDDVANQIEIFGFGRMKEVQQRVSLAAAETKMHI